MSLALSPKTSIVDVQKRVDSSIFANLSYSSEDEVTVHFINRDGERLTTTAKEGQSLLEVVVNHNLAIDGFGRCCSRICTCAVRASGYLRIVQQCICPRVLPRP